MIIIVEFKYAGPVQLENATTQFKTESDLIKWAAEQSVKHPEFEIICINKYTSGGLELHELTLTKGRISLVPKREEMDDTEARMRMISQHSTSRFD